MTPRNTQTALVALLLAGSSVLAGTLPNLTFDARILGSRVEPVVVPREMDDVGVFSSPQHTALRFGPTKNPTGRLEVFPVADVLKLNAKNGAVKQEIGKLRVMLAKRSATSAFQGDLPFFPPHAGDQSVHAAVKYLNFPGGKGIRYLAAYAFDVSTIPRSELFYTFQGLTNDGRYLLSWQQGVPLPEIPQNYEATPTLRKLQDDVFGNVNGAWEKHRASVTKTLDALTNDPRLTRLDLFASTLRVR